MKRVCIAGCGGSGKSRPEIARECYERLNWGFLLHVLQFRQESRPKMLKALAESGSNCQIIVFKTRKHVKNWLKTYHVAH